MSCGLWILVYTLVLAPGTQPASAPAEAAGELEALIEQLSNDSWERREAAQEALVRTGPDAREALERAARESRDPETRNRAESALALIAENIATGPSVITIRGDELNLRDIVDALAAQAGAPLSVFPPHTLEQMKDRRFKLDIERQSFWDAMRQIHEVTGFGLQQWDHAGPRMVQGAPPPPADGVVSGAFLITPLRVSRSRSIDLTGGVHVQEDFHIQFAASAEPKMRVLQAPYAPRLTEALDENGVSLLPPPDAAPPARGGGFAFGSGGMWNLSARLECPPNVGKRIAVLRGFVDAQIQSGAEKLEIPDIRTVRSVSKTVGGVRITVNDLTRTGDTWRLSLTIHSDGATPEQWQRIQQTMSIADVKLLDANGEAFQRGGYSSSGGPTQIDVNMEFQTRNWRGDRNTAEPDRLVWMIPTATRELSVPFEFRDLPIP